MRAMAKKRTTRQLMLHAERKNSSMARVCPQWGDANPGELRWNDKSGAHSPRTGRRCQATSARHKAIVERPSQSSVGGGPKAAIHFEADPRSQQGHSLKDKAAPRMVGHAASTHGAARFETGKLAAWPTRNAIRGQKAKRDTRDSGVRRPFAANSTQGPTSTQRSFTHAPERSGKAMTAC